MSTAVADFLTTHATTPAAGADLVVNGRYKIPHPVTGKPATWQRVTNLAKTLDSGFGLEKWKIRKVIAGLAARDDLVLRASAAGDDKDRLDEIAQAAMEVAGAHSGRDKGTALHELVERINRGEANVTAPGAYAADLAAYRREYDRLGLAPAAVELVLVNTHLKVAGRADLIARTIHRPLPLVADLKTGGVKFAALAIAIQMAAYATADWIYDPATETFTPMLEVDQTEALILHLPAGEGVCSTLTVDLARGIELASQAAEVRDARKAKGLLVPFDVSAPSAAVPTPEPSPSPEPDAYPENRETWIKDRISALANDATAVAHVGMTWPQGVAPKGPWTDSELEAIATCLSGAEAVAGAPFPAPAPGTEVERPTVTRTFTIEVAAVPDDDGAPPDPTMELRVKALLAQVGPAQQERLAAWAKGGVRLGARWDDALTARTATVTLAAVCCARHLWDDSDPDALPRAAITEVTGTDPGDDLGAALARLTRDQAERLVEITERFTASDQTVLERLAEHAIAAAGGTTKETKTP